MLRSLSSEGLLDLSGSRAELESAELPVSLRNLVVRRLGYLPERTAAALRSASILGEAFSLVDLTTVSGRRSSELAEELGEAIKAGLLADREGRLAFRHQLVRDAIYEDISEAARIAPIARQAERWKQPERRCRRWRAISFSVLLLETSRQRCHCDAQPATPLRALPEWPSNSYAGRQRCCRSITLRVTESSPSWSTQ